MRPYYQDKYRTIYHGDCRGIVGQLEGVTAVVTDPPYELGFMGKHWDSEGISFQELTWRMVRGACLPGSPILAFGGTRTQHRIACAIEDAGWEIRDTLMWVYGCLSDDSEVATVRGFVPFHKLTNYDIIMTYDTEKDLYQWETPQRWQVYRVISDTSYRIVSDRTDQRVSRGHRVLVEQSGNLVFKKAEELACVESVPVVPDSILDECSLSRHLLFSSVQREGTRERVEMSCSQGSCGLDGDEQGILSRKDVWGKQSSMEGWGNLFQDTRKLQGREVCSLPTRVHSDGTEGWICHGASFVSGNSFREALAANRSGASFQSRPVRQQSGNVTVLNQQRTQVVRSRKSYQTTLARVYQERYSGYFFCPTVSTGAFVARRNGKVFLTGNSGFPKSLDISKAIDKVKGAEREKVRIPITPHSTAGKGSSNEIDERPWLTKARENGYNESDSNIPATPEAQLWNGYGTALKPAYEPIILAMNPLDKTFANNALEYGVAGLNIDGCRVEYQSEYDKSQATPQGKCSAKVGALAGGTQNDADRTEFDRPEQKGRFPANFLHDGSEEVLELFPESGPSNAGFRGLQHSGRHGGLADIGANIKYGTNTIRGHNDNGGSAARFFYCAKASKRERGENNNHPTVKPLSLMEYLCKLVKMPERNLILDPFCGSGTTLLACGNLGIQSIGIEADEASCEIAAKRCTEATIRMIKEGVY